MKFVLFTTLIWSILNSGWSITDADVTRFEAGLAQIQVLVRKVDILENENRELRFIQSKQQTQITQLGEWCQNTVELVTDRGDEVDSVQNITIEERVTILEAQMTFIQGEITDIQDEVAELEDEVAFLFDEQVLQDERIFNLEERTLDLDTRVQILEENGGDGGNVTALEMRVETLEGTAAEHETDITDLESATSVLDGRVETLEGETSELETRLTSAESQIEDLQATDVELDGRISDLEEGGGATNETTIAFRAVMDETDDNFIPDESTLIFSHVQLNEGNGYDPDTGVFTVPSGGEGYYYFATHFSVRNNEHARIDIRVNDVAVCTMYEDNTDVFDISNDRCNAVVFLSEGDEVKNVYWDGTDTSPVFENTNGVYNGFSGFRI